MRVAEEMGENNIIIMGATCDTRAVTRTPSRRHAAMEKDFFRTCLSPFWRRSPENWGKPHGVFQILHAAGRRKCAPARARARREERRGRDILGRWLLMSHGNR